MDEKTTHNNEPGSTSDEHNEPNIPDNTITIDDVRFASNTKTLLSGNLFTTPSASVGVNTSWNSNIVGTW